MKRGALLAAVVLLALAVGNARGGSRVRLRVGLVLEPAGRTVP